MREADWQRVKDVFQAALDRPAEARVEFLSEACAGDDELRREVESLLTAERDAGAFLSGPGVEEAPDSVAAGQRIGAYRVLGEVGSGGMGRVYRAVRDDDVFRKVVAIKVVRAAASEQLGARLGRERQILARLQHPNIATILDGGATDEGQPYLVMEYVEGEPIDRWCDTRSLGTRERLEMFRLVCGAVHYAHQSLVVHRDIKPQNILVTPDGQPKLLDFGIAKLLAEEGGPESAPTATLLPMMTPEYASPEQVRGAPITTLTDVYSLGVVLYELLSGERPYRFRSDSLEEIVRTVADTEPKPPSLAAATRTTRGLPSPSELRGDLDTIVLKALRKDPLRRYHSAQELAEDLGRHLAGMPVRARKDTVRYRAGKFVGRHRAGVAAAALVVASLVGGLVATLRQARIAEANRARAERRFGDVRKLAGSFLFEFHDAIQGLPGSTPARALVVKRALEYLDSLSQEAGDDVELKRELAAAYQKVGDVQGNPFTANLGDPAGAVQSLEKEVAIREALRVQQPADPTLAIELGNAYRRLGMVQEETGDSRVALQSQLKALKLAEGLDPSGAAGENVVRLRAQTHDRVGQLLLRAADRAGAQEHQRASLAMWEVLAKAHPEDLESLRGLEIAHSHLAHVHRVSGDVSEALVHYRAALDIGQVRAARAPDDVRVRRDLALDYGDLADALRIQGDLTAARFYLTKQLALDEELLAQDPSNSQAQRDLLWCLSQMATLAVASGRLEEALAFDRRVVEAAAKRVEAAPTSFQARKDLAESWGDLSGVLVRLGRLEEALDANRRFVAQCGELLAANPGNADVAGHVALGHGTRGGIFERQAGLARGAEALSRGLLRQALTAYERSMKAWAEREHLGPLEESEAAERSAAAEGQARCAAALRNPGA